MKISVFCSVKIIQIFLFLIMANASLSLPVAAYETAPADKVSSFNSTNSTLPTNPPLVNIEKRYTDLVRVINRHSGFAIMMRGMNSCTIIALYETANEKDLPVLEKMLSDKDYVIRLTVINTLSLMGPLGLIILKNNPLTKEDRKAQEAIRAAPELAIRIKNYQQNGQCKK